MNRMQRTAVALLALGASAAVLGAQGGNESTGFKVFSGRTTFQRYCASCHGPDGEGDGNVAQYLKVPPADLTSLVARYGEFPAEQVRQFIDGRQAAPGHGTREMPVWGEVFQSSLTEPRRSDENGEDRAARIIDQLVAYLESIQATP